MKKPRIAKSFLMEDQCLPILHYDPTIPRGDDYYSILARDALIAWQALKRGLQQGRGTDAIDRLVNQACEDAIEREGRREA